MKNILLTLTAAAALAACGSADEGSETDTAAGTVAATGTAMGTATASTPAAATTVTDPQIAAIVVAANNADIAGGRQAATKSSNAKVKEFAQRMITDHEGVNKAAVALVTKLGVTPEENDVSRQQTEAGKQRRDSLQSMSGADFDRAYIAGEVKYHEDLLAAIDSVLLPSAQNAELKDLLTKTRPAVVSHLDHARELQGAMSAR